MGFWNDITMTDKESSYFLSTLLAISLNMMHVIRHSIFITAYVDVPFSILLEPVDCKEHWNLSAGQGQVQTLPPFPGSSKGSLEKALGKV